jgi:alpha-beta hydrolase superfamily lysophospholipase
MANCRCIVLENAKHELLKETDAVRRQFWGEFDQFIEEIK